MSDESIFICSRLEITAAVCDQSSEQWSRVCEFEDYAKTNHRYVLPMSILAGTGDELRKELLSRGLEIGTDSKAKSLLSRYIQSVKPPKIARLTNQTGWYSLDSGAQVFVLQKETIGNEAEQAVIYQSLSNVETNTQQKGSLEDWQKHVAQPCVGNALLVMAMSLSFAAPMLSITNDENGAVHLRGASSSGKTTALLVAGSVWGGKSYNKNWRATGNGLEGTVSALCDLPLILDEMGQVDSDEVGNIVYMVSNGVGKMRADRTGAARAPSRWRTLLLSAGEVSLEAHMANAGKRSTAGQEVRTVDLPADGGAGLGLFENLQGAENGDVFARQLKAACQSYHGEAGMIWLRYLADNFNEIQEHASKLKSEFLETLELSADCGSQVKRVAARFALIAAAGEIATIAGITVWKSGEAFAACQKCFKLWLENKGSTSDFERKRLLDQVRGFIELHNGSRFEKFSELNKEVKTKINLMAGYKKDTSEAVPPEPIEYLVFCGVYKNEVIKGFDSKYANKILIEEGWLLPGKGEPSQIVNVPCGNGSKRFYRLTSKMLE